MTESLSIGIVTYNHSLVLARTVNAALANLPAQLRAQIWVLDNGSSDKSVEVARQLADADRRVTVIESGKNEGFAKGNNRILQRVDSDYHVFLNPDVTLTPGALDRLVDFLRAAPDVAVVCPRVHFEDGRLQSLNRRHPTVVDLFLSRFAPATSRPRFVRRIQRYRMEDVGYEQPCEVPFVSGAFMCCRTSVLKDVGGFDDRYFLYFEDVDLSRKMQHAGWRTVYCPDAVVTHGWQRATHSSQAHMRLFCVSAMRYFNKWGWQLW
jgi:GT2 family glycosyltransferase